MMDPAVTERLLGGAGGAAGANRRGPDVGACFQLALLAAAQNNDQEAGAYLRRIIGSMKAMVQPEGTDAGVGPSS